ncbi:hypothetical protein [Phytopseudomonas dryadis]|uniref:Uncharacterized protein n=1 Tax=Phytopseudomonas dryadis TaxID=2487520 RepID=A0ABY1Z5W4_9GAMM|nr:MULTISPECIES: hypothetical protein [Pseudomonas]TBV05369.1 hypothetical protein DNK34_12540 [Pseudomonas dryadis]TBV18379.1 hypothetical protein DNK41_08330 [Pseudomonas sp. FRB 230]
MGEFKIYLADRLQCRTRSPVLAQAAWHRSSRDPEVAQAGGLVRMEEGELVIAEMHPEAGVGHGWPDGRDHQADLRDVWDSLMRVLRQAGWDDAGLADALTAFGLNTEKVDGLKDELAGRRVVPSAAELVVLLDAVHARRSFDTAQGDVTVGRSG